MGRRSGLSLRDGLVGAWCPGVSGANGFVLQDLSGNGADMTTNIAATTSQSLVDGNYIGSAFNGSSEGSVTKEVPFFPMFTFLSWMRFSSVNANASFKTIGMKHTVDGSASDFYFYRNATNALIVDHPWVAANVANSGAYTVANNSLGMVALFRSGSTGSWQYSFWHDGEFRANATTASNPNTGNHFIRLAKLSTASGSASSAASNTYFDVRFYSRLLGESELRQVYEMGPGHGLRNERRRSYYFSGGPASNIPAFMHHYRQQGVA
jgi:hypothetical protein